MSSIGVICRNVFNLKKSAADADPFFVEAYDGTAISERKCRECFHKFKNWEFDVEDIRIGSIIKDLCQILEEFQLHWGVTQEAISHHWK